MARSRLLPVLVVTLLVVGLVGYYEFTSGTGRTGTSGASGIPSCTAIVTTTNGSVRSTYCLTVVETGTNAQSSSDVFLTGCVVTGIGGIELRVVSDSTGAPVGGAKISAVDTLGCQIVGQSAQTQIVHIDAFSAGQGGWLTPVFPSPAEGGGRLDFTVVYQGQTYAFSALVPPAGNTCVTLHVPSGNVTKLPESGPCSYGG